MHTHTKRRLQVAIQGLISLGLLAWLLSRLEWSSLLDTLGQASLPLSLLIALLYLGGMVLSSYKWQRILAIEAIGLPLSRLTRWYLIGSFGNNFLPSDIGGDLGRGLYASRATKQPLIMTRTIVIERLTGLLMLLVLAALGVLVLYLRRINLAWLLGLSVLSVLGAATAWRFRGLVIPARLQTLLAQSRTIAQRYSQQPRAVVLILLLSLAFQLLSGLCYWLNLRAVAVQLPLGTIILVSAITNVIGILPISINGWGVREGVFIALLSALNLPTNGVLAGLLLGRGLLIAGSLLGSIPLMLEPASEQRRSGSEE